jgi:hypothetical protein
MIYNWQQLDEIIRLWVFTRLNEQDLQNYITRKAENDI